MATNFRVKWTDFHDLYVTRRLSMQGCAFWGFIDIAPHLGVHRSLKSPQKGRVQAFSSQTRKILKVKYYSNYCTECNQILHSDKDHQMLFVCGPKLHITNPIYFRTAAILKNRKMAISRKRFDRSA